MKLKIGLFMEHHANKFPLDQILKFMKDKNISYGSWSNQMECDYCDSKELEYFREEEVYFNKIKGFYLSNEDVEDDCVDFAIYGCNKCGKWFTYIE